MAGTTQMTWTDSVIAYRKDAIVARNPALSRLCTDALTGHTDAARRLTHIMETGHDEPRGPYTPAERASLTAAGLSDDDIQEMEAGMLARQARDQATPAELARLAYRAVTDPHATPAQRHAAATAAAAAYRDSLTTAAQTALDAEMARQGIAGHPDTHRHFDAAWRR